jgi:hypothetical protein
MSDPIYMERRAFEFFCAFPDVPEILRPVFSRFLDAGLIWQDPNVDETGEWPSQLRWTEAGQTLRDEYEESFPKRRINMFSLRRVCELMPSGDLGEIEKRIFKDQLPGSIPPMGHPLSPKPAGLTQAMIGLEMAIESLLPNLRKAKL